MMEQTEQIVTDAKNYAKNKCGHGIMALSSSAIRKGEMMHAMQQQQGIQSGLMGVFRAIESCSAVPLKSMLVVVASVTAG